MFVLPIGLMNPRKEEKKMLRWDWNAKVGEIAYVGRDKNEYTLTLYEGNAFLIMLQEYKENGEEVYNMYSFFTDKDHAKRCLGLVKGKYADKAENIYENAGWKSVTLYTDKVSARTRKDLVELLLKAMPEVDIVLKKS